MKRALYEISMDEGGAASLGNLNLPWTQQSGYPSHMYWSGTRFYPGPLGMLFVDDGVGELVNNRFLDTVGNQFFGLPFLTSDQTISTAPTPQFTTPNTQYHGSSEFQAQPTRALRKLAYQTIVPPLGSIGGTYAQTLAGMAYELADKFPTQADAEYARYQYGNVQNQNPFISSYVPTMNVEEQGS